MHIFLQKYQGQVVKPTLIQNRRLSSAELKAIKRLSAEHTATPSCSILAIGLEPGFNSLIKNSLNVCTQKIKDSCCYESLPCKKPSQVLE